MTKDEMRKKTAEEMVKPGGGLKLLRKYLGGAEVDKWVEDYVEDKDPAAEVEPALRKRGYEG